MSAVDRGLIAGGAAWQAAVVCMWVFCPLFDETLALPTDCKRYDYVRSMHLPKVRLPTVLAQDLRDIMDISLLLLIGYDSCPERVIPANEKGLDKVATTPFHAEENALITPTALATGGMSGSVPLVVTHLLGQPEPCTGRWKFVTHSTSWASCDRPARFLERSHACYHPEYLIASASHRENNRHKLLAWLTNPTTTLCCSRCQQQHMTPRIGRGFSGL